MGEDTSLGKAVEGHRSPRRFTFTQAIALRASVLDCASPLALWSGPSNVRPCPHDALCLFWKRSNAKTQSRKEVLFSLRLCAFAPLRLGALALNLFSENQWPPKRTKRLNSATKKLAIPECGDGQFEQRLKPYLVRTGAVIGVACLAAS
jgi:hypothetical protein